MLSLPPPLTHCCLEGLRIHQGKFGGKATLIRGRWGKIWCGKWLSRSKLSLIPKSLNSFVRDCSVPSYPIQYHAMPYHTVPYCTLPYPNCELANQKWYAAEVYQKGAIRYKYHTTPDRTCYAIPYHKRQYNTIQYNTIQYNTMQCNTVQCNAM